VVDLVLGVVDTHRESKKTNMTSPHQFFFMIVLQHKFDIAVIGEVNLSTSIAYFLSYLAAESSTSNIIKISFTR